MTKIKLLVLITMFLMFASFSYADQVTATGTMTIGGNGTTDTITMGLSNNVTAVYEDGDVVNTQWYAIATSHLGGTQVYGTAQDVTNLYKLTTEKSPGTVATFTGMPANNTSSADWSTGVWEALQVDL